MERKLRIVSVQPSDLYFVWQLRVQLHNFRKMGISANYQILVFVPNDRINQPLPDEWKTLQEEYPEAQFHFYLDKDNIMQLIKSINYIPLLRLYTLMKHWEKYPELKDDAIFYIDSDIILTKPIDFDSYLQDDVNYLSDTSSYNGANYFDDKKKDVILVELDKYKEIDVLEEVTNMVGISREIAKKNQNCTGGAQYLLKNIDASFWEQCLNSCIKIKLYLANINRRFFPSENAGFQSWTADMWSVLWTLWAKGRETQTPKWMDFAWATDDISRWDEVYIYHDAGATLDAPHLFFKRQLKYVNNLTTPFEDDLSYVSPNYCSYKYAEEINQTKSKNINDEKSN